MATFNIQHPHEQTREDAAEKLKQFAKVVLGDLPAGVTDVDEHWQDDGSLEFGFKAMGMKLSGRMTVGNDEVVVDGKMPFAALPFRGAIESQIRDQLKKALA